MITNLGTGVLTIILLGLGAGITAIWAGSLAERKIKASITRTTVLILLDAVLSLCILGVAFIPLTLTVPIIQLSLGQFLIGEPDVQYRHPMILSIHSGMLFCIYAFWNGWQSQSLRWVTSARHGARVFIEAAFLAYAGLWLVKGAFHLIADQVKDSMAAESQPIDQGLILVWMLGAGLIFAGTLSLMARQSNAWPQEVERVDKPPFSARLKQKVHEAKASALTMWGRFFGQDPKGIKRVLYHSGH